MQREFERGLRCGTLLRWQGETLRTDRDYFVGIHGGKIACVAPWSDATWNVRDLIDASDRVVFPALTNAHTHLPMNLFRGLAEDLSFHDWLHETILPLERAVVDREFIRLGTELALLECIRFGVTTACDMYFYSDAIGDVVDRAGTRAFLGQCVSEYPMPDDPDHVGFGFEIARQNYDRFKSHSRVFPAIGPHAPYSCSDATLTKASEFARKHDLLLSIHVSETSGEVEEHKRQHGATPVERLDRLKVLGSKTLIAHAVHVTEAEIERLAETRTAVSHNPESNMKLAAGAAPIVEMLKRGVRVALGTDSAASNNDLNLFGEMDVCAKLQKVTHKDQGAISSIQVLKMATIGGAEALGLNGKVGNIALGYDADLLVMNFNYPHLQPVHSVTSQLVYAAKGLEIETTICQGQVLYDRGEYKTLDAERIYAEVRSMKDRIRGKLKG